MGRREQGIIGDIMDIASESPPVGAAIALAFCGAAICTQWINPQGLHGFNGMLAMICWLIAVLTLAISGFSFLRQKLGQRKRFKRLSPFCFPIGFPVAWASRPCKRYGPSAPPPAPKELDPSRYKFPSRKLG
jgi:hypothetical protein